MSGGCVALSNLSYYLIFATVWILVICSLSTIDCFLHGILFDFLGSGELNGTRKKLTPYCSILLNLLVVSLQNQIQPGSTDTGPYSFSIIFLTPSLPPHFFFQVSLPFPYLRRFSCVEWIDLGLCSSIS